MNKKGVSSLIAIILIVGLTIAASGIIYNFVIPFLKKASVTDKGCGDIEFLTDAQLSIETQKGFTCFDESGGKLSVQISRGSKEYNLAGIRIKVREAGTSQIIEAREGNATDKIKTSDSKLKLGSVWYDTNPNQPCGKAYEYLDGDNFGQVLPTSKTSVLPTCKALDPISTGVISTTIEKPKSNDCTTSFYFNGRWITMPTPTLYKKYDCVKDVKLLSLPLAAEDETFTINTTAAGITSPEFVSVAPILKISGKESVCKMGPESEVPRC